MRINNYYTTKGWYYPKPIMVQKHLESLVDYALDWEFLSSNPGSDTWFMDLRPEGTIVIIQSDRLRNTSQMTSPSYFCIKPIASV